ncbi:MAG: DNA repair protein RecN [Xanthomonadales bacterium]|nr:DNA repair protein RecN [Xanthomonadales bacterium]
MLLRLYLSEFAIADEIDLDLRVGFGVISGETGAGKSLLVDALMLLSGARAGADQVRHGSARAELQAEFGLGDSPGAAAWLREHELEDGDACRLRRVLRADGGSRAWINGKPASAGQLSELCSYLIEIHGQHEHQALLDRAQQLNLLDAMGGLESMRARVSTHAQSWRQARRELDRLGAAAEPGHAEFLLAQRDELDSVDLTPDRIEGLQRDMRRLDAGDQLARNVQAALDALNAESGGALTATHAALHALRDCETAFEDFPDVAQAHRALQDAVIQLDEAASSLERGADGMEADPARREELADELDRLHDLARKHRTSVMRLHETRAEIVELCAALDRAAGSIERCRRQMSEARESWRRDAATLRSERQRTAERFAAATTTWLAKLGMPGGVIEVAFDLADLESDPSDSGAERIELLVSANAGQPPRPLRRVASGGELSRISLAIEMASLGADRTPTMVFDEVDSGIGGAVAEVVGRTLRALAERCQVLCVTHLPQVAAQAHHHHFVSKRSDGRQTTSAIRTLDDPQRVEELARMLGGIDITEATREHARQMLQSAAPPTG